MSDAPDNLIKRPYRVRFQATGQHEYSGWGWVYKEDEVLITGMKKETIYTIRMDTPPPGEGHFIILGDGEILERGEPVDWANEVGK